jgi:uncharacterized membrane protein
VLFLLLFCCKYRLCPRCLLLESGGLSLIFIYIFRERLIVVGVVVLKIRSLLLRIMAVYMAKKKKKKFGKREGFLQQTKIDDHRLICRRSENEL